MSWAMRVSIALGALTALAAFFWSDSVRFLT